MVFLMIMAEFYGRDFLLDRPVLKALTMPGRKVLLIDEDAKKFVATKGYDVQFGARPLKRAIQNNLEDGISELILGRKHIIQTNIRHCIWVEERESSHTVSMLRNVRSWVE